MKLLIPAATGLEAALKRELEHLGFGHAPAIRGRVELEGDWETVARLNVSLRAGERVLLLLSRFHAETFDELFEGISRIPWEEYFTAHTKILLDGKSYKSKLGAVKAAGGVAKKAICRRLAEKLGASVLDERGERAVVGISLYEDEAAVTLDTSGDGLHKRSYRVRTYEAPLRETTAAAIVEDSLYRREKPFADPFCGSGTFPIEAALYARGIAPGRMRSFDFERWRSVPAGAVRRAREEAREGEYHGPIAPIFASDLSPHAVELAREHARRAGVAEDITFSAADVRTFRSELSYGVVASNPPYGERMMKGEELFPLYRAFRETFRALPDWSAYVITAYADFERAFGRADRRRILYNANLRCGLFTYFGEKPPKDGRDGK